MDMHDLTQRVIGCAFRVHNQLGAGYLEKVYENALAIELGEAGLAVQQQCPIKVYYHGQPIGDFFADLLVESCLIVEIKAVREIAREHEVQLVNYLTATSINDGLLLNFGPSVNVKHKYRVYQAQSTQRSPCQP
jgi:GxxExxY protein